jgi:iron complex outermembrane recepter protein
MISLRKKRAGIRTRHTRAASCIFKAAAALAVAYFVTTSAAHAGNLDRVFPFDIKAQTLDKALLKFAAQANLRISFNWNSARGNQLTRGLKGNYTGREALATLLKGTRLSYVCQGDTVDVRPQRDGRRKSEKRALPADPPESPAPEPGTLAPPLAYRSSTAKPPAPALSEIIVTAQKYRQSAFNVPISLDVVTEQQLQRLNITSLNDLQYDVAGLFVEGGRVNHYIVLRGVSNPSGNGAIVGEYIDDADISSEGFSGQSGYGTGDLQLYDLNRVEVLKGPQGTLYGDGALGGVIRYITNKPALDRTEGSADVSTEFDQYGAPSQRVAAMGNTPVVDGALAIRVAGQSEHQGGWIDEPVAGLKNINSANINEVRVEALWRPIATVKALATQIIHRESYGIAEGEDSHGNITPVFGVTSVPVGNQSFDLSNLTLTADVGPVEILNSSTYFRHTENDYNLSYEIPGAAELLVNLPFASHTFSDELRLQGVKAGAWQWMLGGFYKHELDDDELSSAAYYGPSDQTLAATPKEVVGGEFQQSDSEAAFANGSLRLMRRLIVGAGVRYYENDFRARALGDYINNELVYPRLTAEGHYTSIDPRIYVQYRQSSHVNLYASAAKGFRSGEPNLGLFVGYDPESLWSYEAGAKFRLLDGRLRTDEDAFYEKYSNYVGEGLITVYGVPTYGSFNIGSAGIEGIDVDVTWRISPKWEVGAKGEVVNSKFDSITGSHTDFAVGDRLPLVPSYTFMGSVERDFQWSGRPGFVQVHYSQSGRVDSGISPLVQSDVIRFLGLRTGVRWNANLTLAIFAQNLLNDRGYLDPNWNQGAAIRPRPRTFGLDFKVDFN